MAIDTICSGCGQRLSVADENAGKRGRCPACGQIYTIPYPELQPHQVPEAEPAETAPGPEHSSSPEAYETEAGGRFWMLTADGTQYGPVDRATLNRWFQEGRIGPGYQIRESEFANWQPADAYQPAASATFNPYAPHPQRSVSQPGFGNYPNPDQSGLILAMGILSFFLCPIFGIVAWVMGNTALKDMQAGRADPRNKGLVQVGYYLGIASVLIHLLCFGGWIVIVAISIAAG